MYSYRYIQILDTWEVKKEGTGSTPDELFYNGEWIASFAKRLDAKMFVEQLNKVEAF